MGFDTVALRSLDHCQRLRHPKIAPRISKNEGIDLMGEDRQLAETRNRRLSRDSVKFHSFHGYKWEYGILNLKKYFGLMGF